jgi:NodT family efflux transporter outer membrane factor (OMF) lipoprotein
MLLTALALGSGLGSGCSVRTAPLPPTIEPPPSFSTTGGASLAERWWTAFDDPELDRLVARALDANLDVESAWQRLRQARAVVAREGAQLYPELDGTFDATTREPGPPESELRFGLAASYEVDLWGRIRSSVDAERFRALATLADYQTVALSVSAEVARTWYELVEARSQSTLLAEQVETNETVLRLLRARFGSGQIRAVDILRQKQLVEATRERLIQAETRVEVLENLLAVLLGRAPQEGVDTLVGDLPELPPLPDTGLPAELVQRRPDVRRAFELLQAADRDLAAAISNRYPRLSLSASLSTSDAGADELFDDWMRSLAGNLLAPLFDGGRRRAEVDRNEALRAQRLYEYGQATLVAFREVEDALIQEAKQLERIESLREQVDLASRAYEQLQIEFFNGLADYIDVLTALTEQQQLRRDLIAARRDLLEFRIALYRALAGAVPSGRET